VEWRRMTMWGRIGGPVREKREGTKPVWCGVVGGDVPPLVDALFCACFWVRFVFLDISVQERDKFCFFMRFVF
jgi:hypothetical protein